MQRSLIVSFANYFNTEVEERAFVLGYEFGRIADDAEHKRLAAVYTVRTDNIGLLRRLAASYGLTMEVGETEPPTEGWQVVRFGGHTGGGGKQKPLAADRDVNATANI